MHRNRNLPRLGAFVLIALTALVWSLAGGAARASAAATSYSGEACVLKANLALLNPITLGCATLPSTGGAEHSSLLDVPSTPIGTVGTLNGAEVFGGQTVGQGNESRTHSSVANLDVTINGVRIQAEFLASRATAQCTSAGALLAGDSEILNLTINGQPITVGLAPNTVVFNEAGVTITANKQDRSADGSAIDVAALEVQVAGVGTIDLVTSHADIHCSPVAPPPGCPIGSDFITGGGWFYGAPSTTGQRHFANAAGYKNKGIWGHLVYMDKLAGVKVKGDPVWYGPSGVASPTVFDQARNVLTPIELATELFGAVVNGATNARYIVGTLDGGGAYLVRTVDGGEPGKHVDQFDIAFLRVDTDILGVPTGTYSYVGAYLAASDPSGIEGGNVQLHKPCSSS